MRRQRWDVGCRFPTPDGSPDGTYWTGGTADSQAKIYLERVCIYIHTYIIFSVRWGITVLGKGERSINFVSVSTMESERSGVFSFLVRVCGALQIYVGPSHCRPSRGLASHRFASLRIASQRIAVAGAHANKNKMKSRGQFEVVRFSPDVRGPCL